MVDYITAPYPSDDELHTLWLAAWGSSGPQTFQNVLSQSFTHIGAYHEGKLIGFVNVAWDGGIHAFILDTCVHPQFRRQGIGSQLVKTAAEIARSGNLVWLHVDFEPHLLEFYRRCGFRNTTAGLLQLRQS
jgi:ribosomal protein S18 acetylase RimI-like enzyme